jgi:diguanylate cyclase (GGDEF)-like protein/PAS domain S-box-containing protein
MDSDTRKVDLAPAGALSETERKLRDTQQFLIAVLQNLKEGVIACDADGLLTVFNRASRSMHGKPRESVPPEKWAEVYGIYRPDGKTPMAVEEIPLYRALQGEVVRDAPFVIVPNDGDRRSIIANGQAIFDEDGKKLGAVLTLHDITEQEEARKGLIQRNLHDPLTGLANLSLLTDRVIRAVDEAHADNSLVAVISIDIDDFGAINEEFGHAIADQLLVLFGNRLNSEGRLHDTLARIGGDEFALLCRDLDGEETALAVARQILSSVSLPLIIDGREIRITASVGIALSNGNTDDPTAVMRDAQAALKRARQRGKDQIEVFTAELRAERIERATVIHDLERALDHDEFVLAYQPKVLLETYKVAGVEALLRWDHPERGLIPPLDFIPLAEETGLIIPIGVWVIREACRQAAEWRSTMPATAAPVVCVNVSGRQFGPDLIGVVDEALKISGIEPGMLTLEVTESILMDNLDTAGSVLKELKELGVSIAIDDFGTGYSSLAYLKGFPIDVLKIDRSFVKGLGTDPEDTAIVAAIMGMAHALGLEVVAEGVETPEQLARLRVLGCEKAQGFYFFRPSDAATISAIARREAHESGPVGHFEGAGLIPTGAALSSTVLVADDAADVRLLSRASLSAVGFDVHEAATGSEAIQKAVALKPSCVVLDLSMPDMSGFEVCSALRNNPVTAGATIVILTATATADGKAKAFSLGADDYIVKPFAPKELVSRVRMAMRRRAETVPT